MLKDSDHFFLFQGDRCSLRPVSALQALGVIYTEELIFQDALPKEIPSTPAMRWLGRYARILSPHALFLAWIDPLIGYGVFAREAISTGSVIGKYTGIVRKTALFGIGKTQSNAYCFAYPLPRSRFRRKYLIDAQHHGNLTRFINHSRNGNVRSSAALIDGVPHILLIATRAIASQEQLFYDYGPNYFQGRVECSLTQDFRTSVQIDHRGGLP